MILHSIYKGKDKYGNFIPDLYARVFRQKQDSAVVDNNIEKLDGCQVQLSGKLIMLKAIIITQNKQISKL